MKIKLLQWNIWYQEKVEHIIETIKEHSPDIICLQELTIGAQHHQNKDIPKLIADELQMHCNFAPAHTFPDGHIQGNGIFSKYPLIKNNNFITKSPTQTEDYTGEGRVCAVSTVKIKNKTHLTVATTHGSYAHQFKETEDKRHEINTIINFLQKVQQNTMLCGDFNLTPSAQTIKKIEQYMQHCGPQYHEPTWTTKPFSYNGFVEKELRWRLDYVFATKDIHVQKAKIVSTPYSDHLPIIVEMEIN